MKRSRMVIKNIVWELGYYLVVIILGFLAPRYIILIYGSEVNGLTSTITQIISVILLLQSGATTAAVYSLYNPIAKNDIEEISTKVSSTESYFKNIAFVFLISMVISAFLSAKYINSAIDKDLVFFAVIIIGLKSFFDLLFTSKFRVVFTAYEEKSLISIATLLEQIIYYLLVFMNLLLELPFMYLYLWLLFGCIVKIIFLKHIYKEKHAKIITKNKQKKKLIIHGTYYALANEVAHSIVASSVAVIISFMYGLEEASVYAVYALVGSALSLISTALYSAFAPSFGMVVALKDQKVIESTFSIFRFIYIVFNTVLMMCMLYLLLPFVRLYTKGAQDINYINSGLAYLTAIGGLVSSFRVPYNIIVSSYGLFKQTWLQPSITAILSIILSLVLGRIEYYLVLTGPIVFYLINFIYQHYKLKKIVPFLISKDIIFLLAISVTGLYIAYEMIDWIPIRDGILGWIFSGFIAIVTSVLYLLVSSFIFYRKDLINSITYIKDLILRRKVDD